MIYKIAAVVIILIYFIIITFLVYLAYLIIKALRKYINSKDVREQKAVVRVSLAEQLKENRTRCRMTQEFVAEAIGVSRQAVSKWENGSADPSTSNLIALANLYGISAEDLLKNIVQQHDSNNFSDKDKEYKN